MCGYAFHRIRLALLCLAIAGIFIAACLHSTLDHVGPEPE